MAKKSKQIVCHKCLDSVPFNKKSFDWISVKSFRWVPDEVENSYYYTPICKACQTKKLNKKDGK